jgi:hypothetical protein
MKKVTLKISFEDLFGKKEGEMLSEIRRDRWEQWKEICNKKDPYFVEYWTDTSGCVPCAYIDKDWCLYMELPCTVNPYFSFRTGINGMACMGLKPEQ